MRYISSLIYWFLGFVIFGMLAIIGLIALSISKPEKIRPWYLKLFRLIFKIMFIKVTVEYKENFDVSKPVIIMPNHASFLDAPLFPAYSPCFFVAIEADSHFNWFIYGKLITLWGNIPIARQNIRASLQSFSLAEKKLKENTSILIFPEGHRSKDGNLQKFKKLPFLLAKNAGVGILPVATSGVSLINPKGSFLVYPTNITIKYGKIISPETIQKLSIDELVELTYKEISEMIK